MTVAITDEH